ncbi:OS9, partial [Acrasis kona]
IALLVLCCFVVLSICTDLQTVPTEPEENQINEDIDVSPRFEVIIKDVFSSDITVDSNLYPMMIDNEMYKCLMPKVQVGESSSNDTERHLEQGIESFFNLFYTKCYFRLTGWWIYEFCFNNHVRQFHQEQGKPVTLENFLGKATEPDINKVTNYQIIYNKLNPVESYISFHYTDGTICDLTGGPRKTEVRMLCATDDTRNVLTHGSRQEHFVGKVDEVSTCGYVLEFYTNQLCKWEGFYKKEERVNEIECVIAGSIE